MPRNSSDEDVYRKLVEGPDNRWETGLLAFAIVEEQRFEWMRHFEANNHKRPDTAEIQHWYEQQPASVLTRAKADAEIVLENFSNEVVEIALNDERRAIEEGLIVGEIRAVRRFWPQFGINVAGGVTGALLFAAILVVLAFIVWVDPSPIDLAKGKFGDSVNEVTNGQAQSESGSDQ